MPGCVLRLFQYRKGSARGSKKNARVARWQAEMGRLINQENPTPCQQARRRRLSERLYPVSALPPGQRLPTRLGNRLRHHEQRPQNKYGLDALYCWPHLWLLLPELARAELETARAELDQAARIWLWGLLFLVWTPWAPWAAAVSLGLMLAANHWLLEAADTYGHLLETAFDLHRWTLYDALRLIPPPTFDEEARWGRELSAYLQGKSHQYPENAFRQ